MTKTVSTADMCEKLDEILEQVRERGDRYVIERDGKPVAAVVPFEQFERVEKARERFSALVEKIHERNKDVDPEVVEREVEAAIRETRKRRR
jgi:prevent-host-death family protein